MGKSNTLPRVDFIEKLKAQSTPEGFVAHLEATLKEIAQWRRAGIPFTIGNFIPLAEPVHYFICPSNATRRISSVSPGKHIAAVALAGASSGAIRGRKVERIIVDEIPLPARAFKKSERKKATRTRREKVLSRRKVRSKR